ncbi:2-C-methyl-D-erythritol 4-phosphate cytidylyltransferase [Amycolatopsis endophytica]|uniref:2-C-methyl-D-erythritol 4-phosphate cytidylyltransferase n=1 Tax=Amycolatopsis endophytica TaxID=860233 RepID=A0A853B372_9PSEU|nr:2-C-methyl-D-erythritol 4-phosphate cytidylyltransferase [Amycolatopsis endophytica]NYI89086.1 2-C-methyl-D-erythritol 4-phosphate cytidylyltransferase [Amycolatopsis endophytica]
MKVAALLIADPEGPDPRASVHGAPLLRHAALGLLGAADRLVAAVPQSLLGDCELIIRSVPGAGSRCRVLACGPDRDLRQAIEAAGPADVVLVHDVARPFVPPATVRAVAEAVFAGAEAIIPVLPVTDTVKLVERGVIAGTSDRDGLRVLQAPVGYRPDLLARLCAHGADPLIDLPGTVRTVAGHPTALRLTTAFDVAVAEALLREQG